MRRRLLLAVAAAALALAPNALAAPPSAPDLEPGSDSGASTADDITSDSTPDFTVAGGEIGNYVVLCSVPVGTGATPTPEDWAPITNPGEAASVSLQITTPLTDGTWTITARNVPAPTPPATPTCLNGEGSAALTLVVDTVPPSISTAPELVDIVGAVLTRTFTATPRFDVFTQTGSIVTLYEGTTAIGSGTSVAGTARTRVATPLPDGSHTIHAKAVDLAGNVSANSPATTIFVDATATSAGTPDLLDDDGASPTDNYTSNPRPRFAVQTESAARVFLYEQGVALGSAASDASGVAVVRVGDMLWLDPGMHCLYAIAIDQNGNAGGPSADLCLTIAPGVAPFTSNLGVSLTADYLALVLRPTVRAIAIIRVTRGGKLVAKTTRTLRAKTRTRIALRLPRTARGRLVVTATLRTTDARKLVLRRAVRR